MPAGRPPIFETNEELEDAIQDYFDNVPTKEIYIGDKPFDIPVVTITGLALHLGFCDRRSFYDYEDKEEFTHTIKRARLMIENDYEMQLRTSTTGQAGVIFGLKNLGWKDQRENKVSGDRENPLVVIASEMSNEEATELYKQIIND